MQQLPIVIDKERGSGNVSMSPEASTVRQPGLHSRGSPGLRQKYAKNMMFGRCQCYETEGMGPR